MLVQFITVFLDGMLGHQKRKRRGTALDMEPFLEGQLDHKEGWVPKNWCFQNVVLENKTLKSSLDSREIKPVNPKGNQPWIFIGRTDGEAEAPVFWSPDGKSWLTGKDPDAEKDWGKVEKEVTEDEMVGWHHWLNGH